MKNIKLFEEFSGKNIPQERDLVLQIVDFLGISGQFNAHKRPHWDKSSSFYSKKAFDEVSPEELYKFLSDQGYSISTYPKLSPSAIKSKILMNKINYSKGFGDETDGYAFIILIDCIFNDKRAKTCLTILDDSLGILVLGKSMNDVSIKEWNDRSVEMIFWNGDYLVTGEFEVEDVNRDGEIVTIDFVSVVTSDNRKYDLSVSADGSWAAGYELQDIEYLDYSYDS